MLAMRLKTSLSMVIIAVSLLFITNGHAYGESPVQEDMSLVDRIVAYCDKIRSTTVFPEEYVEYAVARRNATEMYVRQRRIQAHANEIIERQRAAKSEAADSVANKIGTEAINAVVSGHQLTDAELAARDAAQLRQDMEHLGKTPVQSDTWVVSEPGYVKAMTEKANRYYGVTVNGCYDGTRTLSSDNEWFVMVDCDWCRIMWFRNTGSGWKLAVGQDCSVGCRGIEISQRGVTDPRTCNSVRSVTFKGVMHVLPGRYAELMGMSHGVCYVPCSDRRDESGNYYSHTHAELSNWSATCQKMHNLCGRPDPSDAVLPDDSTWGDYVPFEQSRFTSHGCICLRDDTAKWNFETLPDETDIIIFDRWNPTPGLGGADSRVYGAGYSDAFDQYAPSRSEEMPPRPVYD